MDKTKEYMKLRNELIDLLIDSLKDKDRVLLVLMKMLAEQTELNNLQSALELAQHKAEYRLRCLLFEAA